MKSRMMKRSGLIKVELGATVGQIWDLLRFPALRGPGACKTSVKNFDY